MEVSVFTSEHRIPDGDQKITSMTDLYYPCLVTTWEVSYRSFLKKPRKHKRVMMTNLIKGDSSFGNEELDSHVLDVEGSTVMEAIHSNSDARENAKEMLRRYYLHYVRVWSVPEITCLTERMVYFPYVVFDTENNQGKKNSTLLYEPVSNLTEKLNKFPEIEEFHQKQKRG